MTGAALCGMAKEGLSKDVLNKTKESSQRRSGELPGRGNIKAVSRGAASWVHVAGRQSEEMVGMGSGS